MGINNIKESEAERTGSGKGSGRGSGGGKGRGQGKEKEKGGFIRMGEEVKKKKTSGQHNSLGTITSPLAMPLEANDTMS